MSKATVEEIFQQATLSPSQSVMDSRLASYEDIPMTKAERRTVINARNQTSAILLQIEKAKAGINGVAAIYDFGFNAYADAGSRIWTRALQPDIPEVFRPMLLQYAQYSSEQLGVNIQTMGEHGIDVIAQLVRHSPYSERRDRQRKWWQRDNEE